MTMYNDDINNLMKRSDERSGVFAELRRRDIAEVKVHFSGGNDEGGADDFIATSTTGEDVKLAGRAYQEWQTKEWVVYENRGQRPATTEEIADQQLLDALEAPIYAEYGSFAGDFSVDGVVTWDVTNEKVTMVKDEQSGYDHYEYDV